MLPTPLRLASTCVPGLKSPGLVGPASSVRRCAVRSDRAAFPTSRTIGTSGRSLREPDAAARVTLCRWAAERSGPVDGVGAGAGPVDGRGGDGGRRDRRGGGGRGGRVRE